MDVLSKFGFDIKLFIAQIVNFLIIAYIFKRYLYKPILTTLKKRSEIIESGINNAKKAQKTLDEAEEKRKKMLKVTSLEAEKMLEQAKLEAESVKENLVKNAKQEIDKMMLNAKNEIEAQRADFRKEAEGISLELSRKILEKTIKSLFDKKDQQTLLEKATRQKMYE